MKINNHQKTQRELGGKMYDTDEASNRHKKSPFRGFLVLPLLAGSRAKLSVQQIEAQMLCNTGLIVSLMLGFRACISQEFLE